MNSLLTIVIASRTSMGQSFSSFMDYDLTPVPMTRPSASIEPLQWTVSDESTPSPTDSPNSIRRLQLWTCCKPEPTRTTEEHRNSKLTHEPTEHPTPEPTPKPTASPHSFGEDFCRGLIGCRYYKNDCEDLCGCDWDRGIETCADCSNPECIYCESGYTLSDGQCQASGAFNLVVDGSEDTLHDESPTEGEYLWIGIGIGFAVCLVIIMLIVFWRRYKKENSKVMMTVNDDNRDIDDENDGIKLTDDHQLDTVPDTMTTIKLNESLNLNETQPMDVTA